MNDAIQTLSNNPSMTHLLKARDELVNSINAVARLEGMTGGMTKSQRLGSLENLVSQIIVTVIDASTMVAVLSAEVDRLNAVISELTPEPVPVDELYDPVDNGESAA